MRPGGWKVLEKSLNLMFKYVNLKSCVVLVRVASSLHSSSFSVLLKAERVKKIWQLHNNQPAGEGGTSFRWPEAGGSFAQD